MSFVGIVILQIDLLKHANWALTGIAVRFWQLGIEMRPLFQKQTLWVYPLFATVGGSFGYWLEGVDKRQLAILAERKQSLLEKRQRRAEREATDESNGFATAS
ncbi:hypothetical protein GX48_00897 [Paracoccidioides brasiliensis]|nr:hypothetical protein GX48_00897 [Paracoccidioides brasiliensis]